jgi:hypothetical protein
VGVIAHKTHRHERLSRLSSRGKCAARRTIPRMEGVGRTGASDARVGTVALAYGAVLAAFIILPALAPSVYPPYPLLRWGDVIDLFTPLVVLPLAWCVFRVAASDPPRGWETVLFVAFAALWASGQGMHLAGNAIGHLVEEGPTDLYRLTHDLDEVVSHYIWHIGLIGLAGLTMLRALRGTHRFELSRWSWGALGVGAALYGFTFFVATVEAATTPMSVPAALLLLVGGGAIGRSRLASRPVLTFFLAAFVLALVLCFAWAAMNGWQLVEFSKAGLIK